ncbi:MAG: M23 family metallopeptidase [bacterium]
MIRSLLLALIFSVTAPLSSHGDYTVSVRPEKIRQGDALLITVRGGSSALPSGTIGARDLIFHRNQDGMAFSLAFIGLEQPAGKYTLTIVHDGRTKKRILKVLPVKVKKIHLSLPEDKVTLSPEDEQRADRERERMKSFWEIATDKIWDGRFINPVDEEISTEFGLLRIINNHKESMHRGIDYRGAEGTPVRSINAGKVVLSDDEFFGGNTVMIDHGEGIFSVYMHLQQRLVTEGQMIQKGEIIGLIGSSGRSTGPHLHLSVKYRDLSVNPLSLFQHPLD